MKRELSKERRDILEHLERVGEPQAPAVVAGALGKHRSAVKKLMYSMLEDGQLVALGGGKYALPVTEPVTEESEAVTEAVTEPVAEEPKKPRLVAPPPIEEWGIMAWTPEGMISEAEHRRRKGYDGV